MKILQITPSFSPSTAYGGPTKSVDNLCSALVKAGLRVDVYTTTANGRDELDIESGVELININSVRNWYFKRITKDHSHFSPSLLYHVFMNAKKYDIVHIHSWWNLVAMPSVLLCLLRGVRPILSTRGMLSNYTFKNSKSFVKKVYHNLIGKRLLKFCILHVTSEKEKKEIENLIGFHNNFILPNIIKLPSLNHNPIFVKKSKFKFVILSRIHPVKNIEFFFECLADLKFDYAVDIIGDGDASYIRKLKKKADTLGIVGKINWLGHIEALNKKIKLLNQADLFIQLSLTENFGNSVIEAASVGIPVLVSKEVGVAKYVENLKLGYTSPLSKEKVVEMIERYNKLPLKEKYEFKQKVKKNTHKYFSTIKLVSSYIENYLKFKV